MFSLEQSIAEWRQQMLAAGIKTPVPLEELEIHLRDDVEERMRSGATAQQAFETTVRQIGQGEVLQTEFARAGETFYERMKQLFCALAGIPNYQLATNMNTSNSNLEPRWATYLKSAALIVPAILVWVGSLVFVVPKLKEICAASGTAFPKPVLMALALSDFYRSHIIPASVMVFAALIWLEWRSHRWPRYRRVVFGITAFSVNLVALIFITTMMVFAVLAAANLLHPMNGGR
jgi:hypothetical protein